MFGRILGVDYGDVRTGIAISDALGISAQPKELIQGLNVAKQLERIVSIASENNCECIIIGLPLNMDGTEGPRVVKARKFGDALAEASNIEIKYWDERLSSAQAERALRGLTSRHKKKHVDVMSAQFILQSYLDANKSNYQD